MCDALEVLQPHDGKTHTVIEADSLVDVDNAYEQARDAQAEWAETGPLERVDAVRSLLDTIEDNRKAIIETLVVEAGSTYEKAEAELDSATGIVTQSMGYPSRVSGSIKDSNIDGKTNHVHRNPVGVVTAITAWNFPFHLACRIVAPAIALGNAVVLKPSPETPDSGGLLFRDLCDEAGIPDGLVNVVVGRDDEIGDHVAGHPDSDFLAFTGSTTVGKHVGKLAVENVTFPALELGGNSPQIVLPDADVQLAAEKGAFGSFFHSGQVCTATNRHIVHTDVVEEYTEALTEHAEAWADRVGPLINEVARTKVHDLVQRSIRTDISSPLDAGIPQCGVDYDGLTYEPTVIRDVTNAHPICKNEHFGPVAPIIEVQNDREAIEVANDADRGLSSSVWGHEGHATCVGRQIQSGMVHINDHTIGNEAHVPFGGMKHSGIGRYNDEPLIQELTETQCLAVQRP